MRVYSWDGRIYAEDGIEVAVEAYERAAALGLVQWIAPPGDVRLSELRGSLRARVNELREQAKCAGFEWRGVRWDTDAASRENLTAIVAAVSAGVPLPSGFTWRSEANQDIPMTAGDLVALAAAMLSFGHACYLASWALKREVDGSKDPAAVDLFAHWPVPLRPTPPPAGRPLPPPRDAPKL